MISSTTAAHTVFEAFTKKIPTVDTLTDILADIRGRREVSYEYLLDKYNGRVPIPFIEVIQKIAECGYIRSYVMGPTMVVQWIGD